MATIYHQAVSPGASFASPGPDVSFGFLAGTVKVVNEDSTAANYVEVSFDGTTVHDRLIPGVYPGFKYTQRVNGVWLRKGAGSPTVRVVAEAPDSPR